MNKVNCKYCNKELSPRGLTHQKFCKDNPNKVDRSGKNNPNYGKVGGNQFTKAKEKGLEVPIVSKETRLKLSENAKGRTISEEHKKILSESAKKNGLGGVRQSMWIEYNGKTLGSSYEHTLAIDLDANNIKWDTCSRFKYLDPNGKHRTYTPDIYLIDYDVYLDPKNDYLINNVNPRLGFKDCDKIKLVEKQNNVKIFILNKTQLTWEEVKQAASL
tara:strand:+ start:75 stop:722 length:648 start_codon:yes stop_codon:yes gene_type:complete